MRIRNRTRRMLLSCGLPEDAVTGCARVTLCGRSSVLAEGQHGVVEMSGERIRMKTSCGTLVICGKGMKLQELSIDAAMVTGEEILSVGYGNA